MLYAFGAHSPCNSVGINGLRNIAASGSCIAACAAGVTAIGAATTIWLDALVSSSGEPYLGTLSSLTNAHAEWLFPHWETGISSSETCVVNVDVGILRICSDPAV